MWKKPLFIFHVSKTSIFCPAEAYGVQLVFLSLENKKSKTIAWNMVPKRWPYGRIKKLVAKITLYTFRMMFNLACPTIFIFNIFLDFRTFWQANINFQITTLIHFSIETRMEYVLVQFFNISFLSRSMELALHKL